ncbi:MAG: hypothetical protein J0H55_04615 [Chitinophagaceae bacterium]|nr:hypothetical protein [Chitinophagaceae bacterium]
MERIENLLAVHFDFSPFGELLVVYRAMQKDIITDAFNIDYKVFTC